MLLFNAEQIEFVLPAEVLSLSVRTETRSVSLRRRFTYAAHLRNYPQRRHAFPPVAWSDVKTATRFDRFARLRLFLFRLLRKRNAFSSYAYAHARKRTQFYLITLQKYTFVL